MKKNVIVYGKYEGLAKRAIEILSQTIMEYTKEYPDCISSTVFVKGGECRYFFVGTKKDNPFVEKYIDQVFAFDEEYAIKVCGGDVIICGKEDSGVLYGCIDFYSKYILSHEYSKMEDCCRINVFTSDFADFECTSQPSVKNRGIWTWGHVIYDYKGFFDNMMHLKMNTIIIWNDYVPLNAEGIVEYAHSCGIKVIWGFSWLWDLKCGEIDIRHINSCIPGILEKYEREYSHLHADGLYFQSFTELTCDTIDGIAIADAVTGFVNKTAGMILEKYPTLELQFGLHASSVKERLSMIKNVNKAVKIVWEDLGASPFSYVADDFKQFDEVMELIRKVAVLRGVDDPFGVVLKGCTKLDWNTFRHLTGPQCIGVTSRDMQDKRVKEKAKIWKHVQANWIAYAPKIYEMIALMNRIKAGQFDVTVLVEDGMFERTIYYPVALCAEMLWEADADVQELIKNVAMKGYVDFA